MKQRTIEEKKRKKKEREREKERETEREGKEKKKEKKDLEFCNVYWCSEIDQYRDFLNV